MARTKPPHHRGTHQVRARRITRTANANPDTRCRRCHNTLPNCKPHRNGTPAYWTAGHLVDGQVNGPLQAECSTCNFSAGATAGNNQRRPEPHSERW